MALELGDVRYWMNSGKHLLSLIFPAAQNGHWSWPNGSLCEAIGARNKILKNRWRCFPSGCCFSLQDPPGIDTTQELRRAALHSTRTARTQFCPNEKPFTTRKKEILLFT